MRPVKEIQFTNNYPHTVAVKEVAYYNAAPTRIVIIGRNSMLSSDSHLQHSYSRLIPIPNKKFNQFQELKRFVAEEH